MRRCAFLTLEESAGYFIDDELAHGPLSDLGWVVDAVPWTRAGVAWGDFAAVVIRSTWDYTRDPDRFLLVLAEIERSGTRLFNPLDLVRWNLRKTYLRELAEGGVPVVPTVWRDRLLPGELPGLLEEVGGVEAVIKPVIGGGARGAYRLDRGSPRELIAAVEAHYADRALMAQPFVPAITAEGEFSLFYFNGEHTHTVLKTPKAEDFRVQPEHGGIIRAVEAEEALHAAGKIVLGALGEAPLYARADFVRANEGGGFWLMELELIEPSLYLRMDAAAPVRFARALHERFTEEAGS